METIRIANNELDKAVDLLKAGKIVAFPTDTVYGLGCVYDDEEAIKSVKNAKGRDENKPLPMMCAGKSMISDIAEVNEIAARIIEKLMPGALTIVLKKRKEIPDYVNNGKETIAIRIPDHPLTRYILEQVDKPMLVTSANLSDYPSCKEDSEVIEQLDGRVDGIVMGSADADLASTIVLVDGSEYKILRQGKISDAEIIRALEGEE